MDVLALFFINGSHIEESGEFNFYWKLMIFYSDSPLLLRVRYLTRD